MQNIGTHDLFKLFNNIHCLTAIGTYFIFLFHITRIRFFSYDILLQVFKTILYNIIMTCL